MFQCFLCDSSYMFVSIRVVLVSWMLVIGLFSSMVFMKSVEIGLISFVWVVVGVLMWVIVIMVRNIGSIVQNIVLKSESWYIGVICVIRLVGVCKMKNWIRQVMLEMYMVQVISCIVLIWCISLLEEIRQIEQFRVEFSIRVLLRMMLLLLV